MMPKMDGIELTKRLREDEATSKMPIILLTARTQELGNRARALKLVGDILVARGGHEVGAAEALYAEALALADGQRVNR